MTEVPFWPCSLLQGKDKSSVWRSLVASFILCPLPAHWAAQAAGRAQSGHVSQTGEAEQTSPSPSSCQLLCACRVFFVRLREPTAPGVPCTQCVVFLLQQGLRGCVLPADLPWHGAGSWEAAGWAGPAEPGRAEHDCTAWPGTLLSLSLTLPGRAEEGWALTLSLVLPYKGSV